MSKLYPLGRVRMKNTMSTMVKHLVACSALLFLFICFAELLTGCASPVSANPRLAPHLDVSFHEMVNAPNGASYVFHVQWTTYSLPNEIWGRGEASISVPPTGVLGDYEALAKPSRTQAVRLASGRFFAGFSMMRRGAAEQPGETGLFPCF